MKKIVILVIFIATTLFSEELRVKSKSFNADQKKGISIFEGTVNVIKGNDELNASKVTIYTDAEQKPTKFIAEGNASFSVLTEEKALYVGKAQKVIYIPESKEYYFYENVHLKQINERKEIIGDEVVLKTIEGKAYANSVKDEPVVMIFDMPEEKEKKKKGTKEK